MGARRACAGAQWLCGRRCCSQTMAVAVTATHWPPPSRPVDHVRARTGLPGSTTMPPPTLVTRRCPGHGGRRHPSEGALHDGRRPPQLSPLFAPRVRVERPAAVYHLPPAVGAMAVTARAAAPPAAAAASSVWAASGGGSGTGGGDGPPQEGRTLPAPVRAEVATTNPAGLGHPPSAAFPPPPRLLYHLFRGGTRSGTAQAQAGHPKPEKTEEEPPTPPLSHKCTCQQPVCCCTVAICLPRGWPRAIRCQGGHGRRVSVKDLGLPCTCGALLGASVGVIVANRCSVHRRPEFDNIQMSRG